MMYWIYFALLSIIGYATISVYAKMVGSEANSLTEALVNTVRPLPFVIMVVANLLLGVAVYFGFLATPTAMPIMLSIGLITTFAFSVVALGVTVTAVKIVGILFIITGIFLLK